MNFIVQIFMALAVHFLEFIFEAPVLLLLLPFYLRDEAILLSSELVCIHTVSFIIVEYIYSS